MITLDLVDMGVDIGNNLLIKVWYKDTFLHRDNGPAILADSGYQEWYRWGKYHRTDGPARVWPNGAFEYWISNRRVTEYEHMFLTRDPL